MFLLLGVVSYRPCPVNPTRYVCSQTTQVVETQYCTLSVTELAVKINAFFIIDRVARVFHIGTGRVTTKWLPTPYPGSRNWVVAAQRLWRALGTTTYPAGWCDRVVLIITHTSHHSFPFRICRRPASSTRRRLTTAIFFFPTSGRTIHRCSPVAFRVQCAYVGRIHPRLAVDMVASESDAADHKRRTFAIRNHPRSFTIAADGPARLILPTIGASHCR